MKRIQYIILLFVVASLSSCGYNDMVTLDETAVSQWANVESAYQRRSDLIPNLVKTVKAAAASEKGILTEVIEARAKATSVNIDANNLTPEAMAQFQSAQEGLSGALSKLMVSVERYPDIKSNENFLNLQTQLEGTENRISVERRKFNQAVKAYNTKIRTFPNNIFSSLFGFEKKGYFKAEAGSEKAPEVSF